MYDMGVFSIFVVPFAGALCYNIKLTDYAILVNAFKRNEPGIVCKTKLINHNRPEKSRA